MLTNTIEQSNTRAAVATSRHYIRTAAELFNDPTILPRKPIFGDWLLERGLAMLYAPSGIGKSWLSLSIATAIAGGGSLHNWNAPSAERVMLVDGEMDLSDIKDRLGIVFKAVKGDAKKAASNLNICARKDPHAAREFLDLATDDGRDELLQIVEAWKPKLLVLDNLSTLANVGDENAAHTWDPVLATLQAVQQSGCTVLLVHHARKNVTSASSYRGSQKLSVLLDIIIALRENPEAGVMNGSAFNLRFEKSRGLSIGAGYELETKFEAHPDGTSAWSFESSSRGQIGGMVRRVKEGEFTTQVEIAQAYGVDKGTITRWRNKAVADGLITRTDFEACLREARRNPSDRSSTKTSLVEDIGADF
jgi:KaiC/GvpD/RAD55 family RecA-like ATPase